VWKQAHCQVIASSHVPDGAGGSEQELRLLFEDCYHNGEVRGTMSVWYGVVWYDVVCGMGCGVWCVMNVLCGVVWYDMVCGMVWCVAWCVMSVIWCGMVCGVVWCGVMCCLVCYDVWYGVMGCMVCGMVVCCVV